MIAGPCVVESAETVPRGRRAAEGGLRARAACRSCSRRPTARPTARAARSFAGLPRDRGARRSSLACGASSACRCSPTCTRTAEVAAAAEVADCCRSRRSCRARPRCSRRRRASGRAVNVKKGQFLAPDDMKHVVEKLTERRRANASCSPSAARRSAITIWWSTCAALVVMRELGWPVVYDATHSLQRPGGERDRRRPPLRASPDARRGGVRRRRRCSSRPIPIRRARSRIAATQLPLDAGGGVPRRGGAGAPGGAERAHA